MLSRSGTRSDPLPSSFALLRCCLSLESLIGQGQPDLLADVPRGSGTIGPKELDMGFNDLGAACAQRVDLSVTAVFVSFRASSRGAAQHRSIIHDRLAYYSEAESDGLDEHQLRSKDW